MKIIYNIAIIFIVVILYFVNQKYKTSIDNEYLNFFMVGYFNDMIGGIAFASYINLVTNFSSYKIKSLRSILAIIFVAGMFWEFVTPLYRKNSTSDILDIPAYLIGGCIYYLILKMLKTKE